jgi:hypothetical protein
MRDRWLWRGLGVLACLTALPAEARGGKAWAASVDRSTLNAISERGRYLAQAERLRDKTALEATLLKRPIQPNETAHYIVYKEGETWYTAFGTLSSDLSTFFVDSAFAASVARPEAMKAIDPGTLPLDPAPFARASVVATEEVTPKMYERFRRRPQEPIVLKVGDGYIAYVTPRERSLPALTLGGDYKVKLSADGSSVVALQELHPHLYPFDLSRCPSTGCIGTVHLHEHESPPTETDVAEVMRHPGLSPHFVRSAGHIFQIEKSGELEPIASLKQGIVQLEGTTVELPTAGAPGLNVKAAAAAPPARPR